MGELSAIGSWISENESLLSGLAAMIVLAGVVLSPLGVGVRRMLGIARTAKPSAEPAPPRKLSLRDLTQPAPHPIHYADADGVRIAYCDRGQGPPTLVMAPGIISHQHLMANLPTTRNLFEALSFGRLVGFDKRGHGLSDTTLEAPDVVTHSRDIEAVYDAAGLERAFLLATSEGGPMAIQFAHDHPERVQGLILLGTTASWVQREDFPIGIPRRSLEALASRWGQGRTRDVFFPSLPRDEIDDETFRAFEALIASRDSMIQNVRMMLETDVRPLLPHIRVPTLVIHFTGDLAVPLRLGRAMAAAIPDAEFLEVAGTDHVDLSQAPEAVARVRRFCDEVLRSEAERR